MRPGDYTPAAQSQVVSWQLKRLPPPSSLYVTVDDALRVAAASSQANEVVTVSYRLLRAADGKIIYGQFTVAPASDRSIAVNEQPMAEGFLLSVSCKAAVATTRGQTFVRLFLNPKTLGAGQPGLMMMADYVTTRMAPGFPNGRALAPSEGPGNPLVLLITQPGAGADWAATVPSNARWKLRCGRAVLATDAVAANRYASLVIQAAPGGLAIVYQVSDPGAPIVAGDNKTLSFGAASVPLLAGQPLRVWNIPPGVLMLAGWSVASSTAGLDAGDQWSLVRIEVEEWLDNV